MAAPKTYMGTLYLTPDGLVDQTGKVVLTKDELLLQVDAARSDFTKLREAVKALYYAAYWHADRDVDEPALWTAVRDAACLPPGESKIHLGEDQSGRKRLYPMAGDCAVGGCRLLRASR